MKRFFLTLFVGSSLFGCTFIVYATYRVCSWLNAYFNKVLSTYLPAMFMTLKEYFWEFLAETIESLFNETGIEFFGSFAIPSLIAVYIMEIFIYLCIDISQEFSRSDSGLRFFLWGWIGLITGIIAESIGVIILLHQWWSNAVNLGILHFWGFDINLIALISALFYQICLSVRLLDYNASFHVN